MQLKLDFEPKAIRCIFNTKNIELDVPEKCPNLQCQRDIEYFKLKTDWALCRVGRFN